MLVGERIKSLRESKGMSQGDIERETNLLRCYTSRVENGHTVPSVETLEKFARALGVEMYELFMDPDTIPAKAKATGSITSNGHGIDRTFLPFRKIIEELSKPERRILLSAMRSIVKLKAA